MQRHFLYPPRELPSRSLLQFMNTSKSRKRCELYRAYKHLAQVTRQEESTYILSGFLSADMERDICGFGDEAVLRIAHDEAGSGDDNGHENTNESNESSSLGQGDYEANHYEEADDLQENDDDFGIL
ncbi:Hypothetical protein GLP15_1055 [Giardia lamblia P15]|uniref:Uncharacterized protein n=1 Tax=Giardia intestinalis (strain P15) TaxID=658858 RepID=E1F2Y2_GIAIA|nr:Hypothetical protein GLP15_1055 [Giardia lamblia P15]